MSDPHHGAANGAGPPSSNATSRSLLQGVRAGDTAAWERLVALYAPLILHWCRRWDLQPQDTADVFQEVFLAVAKHIGTFRKERRQDTFRGWLRTITSNKVHDHYRRLGREPAAAGGTEANRRLAQVPAPQSGEEDSAAGQGVEAADAATERALYYRTLNLIRGDFAERTWQAFWRVVVEGRSAAEVAQELRMSPGAVRVAKSRVLQRLREELGDVGE
jgi:RNA polymerase sigma-70 factor (ECF subfamily)